MNQIEHIVLCNDKFRFFHFYTWMDVLVRWITKSKFNHAIEVFKDCDNQLYVLHATGIGVNMLPLVTYLRHFPNREFYMVMNENLIINTHLGKALLGCGYQFGIFRQMLLFYTSKKIFGPNSKITKFFSTEEDKNKWFCFEFIGKLLGMENPWLLTGKDFEEKFNLEKIDLNLMTLSIN